MNNLVGARPISEKLRLTDGEVAGRKAFLEFTEADAALLRELHVRLETRRDAFADAFYTHLLRFPELAAVLGDGDRLERLKTTQAAYFSRLTEGEYGPDYVEHRLHVGLAHQRAGLTPKWYVGAYRKYLGELLPAVFHVLDGDAKKYLATCDALLKIIFLDMDLALETYFYAEQQALAQAHQAAEENIRQSNARWKDLYNNAPCGYHSLDQDGLFVEVNDTELGWLGYRREEVVARMRFRELLSPQWRDAFDENFRELRQDGRMRDLEVELTARDGALLPALLSATAVRDDDGNFLMSRTMVYNMTERKKLEQELLGHGKRISDLSHRVVQLKEEEMKRLSSELHEQCSPNLAALKINFRLLAELLPEPADEKITQLLNDTSQLLSQTTTAIREVCAELRPSVLDYAGLWKALESYALNFTRRTAIPVRFSVHAGDLKLSNNIETMLFRIAQEALTNCEKHAQAKTIQIAFERQEQVAVLTICDDGAGFNPGELGKNGSDIGIGLLTMRDRAEFVGGRLSIDAASGRGTCVKVELPL